MRTGRVTADLDGVLEFDLPMMRESGDFSVLHDGLVHGIELLQVGGGETSNGIKTVPA